MMTQKGIQYSNYLEQSMYRL